MPFLDLHAHFPMQFTFKKPPKRTKKLFALNLEPALMTLANCLANFQFPCSARVTLPQAAAGHLKGFASVLYYPPDELLKPPKSVPGKAFANLKAQAEKVKKMVEGDNRFVLVASGAELAKVLEGAIPDGKKRKIPVFHCIEGAYAIEHEDKVETLAKWGVAYVTIAHLLFNNIARPANAFPFLDDNSYDEVFGICDVGLTDLAKRICRKLFKHKILVDIVHCHKKAIDDIFNIAAECGDPPIIASHTAARGVRDALLNVSDDTIDRIKDTKGVVGLIFYGHWLETDKDVNDHTLLFKHIDHIAEKVCGSEDKPNYDHIAIGSDLDGFITPVNGLANLNEAQQLKGWLMTYFREKEREKDEDKIKDIVDKILWKNALRVLKKGWG